MKLYELNHETIIRTGNNTFLLYKRFSLFVIISILENNIGNDKSNRTGDTLNTMNENIFFIFMCILNEINNSVKETLDILILRILKEES